MLMRHLLLAGLASLALTAQAADGACHWRDATPDEQRLDAAAFEGFDPGITERMTDVQSMVVVLQGRVAYQYHRDGKPDALRDPQSVAKTAVATLVGVALQQGQIRSLDQPVLELMPEWQSLNDDPRTKAITVRHLLSMTPGFEVNDPTGTAAPMAPAQAWKRPLRNEPGQSFAYDNSVPLLLVAVLQKVTGQRLADHVQAQLVQPLGMAPPAYRQGLVQLRTVDMAKLGQLYLQDGQWEGRPLLPPGFVAETTRAHSRGGPPVQMPYGLSWWLPTGNTYIASGYGGQLIWVHPPRNVVVAVTSTVSPGSQERGQAMRLVRERVFAAIQKRWQPGACAP